MPTLDGPEPLYDSGWVLTNAGYQNFVHDLDAFPTLWDLQVADDEYGDFPTQATPWNKVDANTSYGVLVTWIGPEKFRVCWQPSGIGYKNAPGETAKFYQRGVDYARLRIFATDTEGGSPPPRP